MAAAFLAGNPGFRLDPIRRNEVPDEMQVKDGRLRILPGAFADAGGADGFFIARFARINED